MNKAHQTDEINPNGSLVSAELLRIAERCEAAGRRARAAADAADRDVAEDERREANGQFWAFGVELADLFLLLLRHAHRHRADAVRIYLSEILDPDFNELADAIAKVEGRRRWTA